jgi:hypothetical protein
MHELLRQDDVHWVGIRFFDPMARVFLFNGEYYRAIYPHRVDYVRHY